MNWPKNLVLVEDMSQLSEPTAAVQPVTDVRYIKKSKLQLMARDNRQKILSQICAEHSIPLLLTGHQLDDDIAGFFFRMVRMSGLEGISSLKPYATLPFYQDAPGKEPLIIGKPLVDYPKKRLIDTCLANGFQEGEWVLDEGNSDNFFVRNKIRRGLIELQDRTAKEASLDPSKMPVTLEALRNMLRRVKEANEETRFQLRYAFQSSVVLSNSPIRQSAVGQFNNVGNVASPLLEALGLSNRDTLDEGKELAALSLLERPCGVTNQSGDAMLVFPTQGRLWYSNKYLLTKVIMTIGQYVKNDAMMHGFYTAFNYACALRTAAMIRVARERRLERSRERLQNYHNFPSQSEGSSSTSETAQASSCIDVKKMPSPSTNFHTGLDIADSLSRLPFLNSFSLMCTVFAPISSVDNYHRRQLLTRLNEKFLDALPTINSALTKEGLEKHPKFRLSIPMGPAIFCYYEGFNQRIIDGFLLDFVMKPDTFYSYQDRLLFRLFPRPSDVRRLRAEADLANFKEEILLAPPKTQPRRQSATSGNMSAFLPSMEYKAPREKPAPPFYIPIYDDLLFGGGHFSRKQNATTRVNRTENEPSKPADDLELDNFDILELPDGEFKEMDEVSEMLLLQGRQIQAFPKPEFSSPEKSPTSTSITGDPQKDTALEEFIKRHINSQSSKKKKILSPTDARKFRFCMLTLNALKYMALIADRTGQKETLSMLETIRQAVPVNSLHVHPLFVEMATGFMSVPSLGITIKPIAALLDDTVPVVKIESYAKGNSILFNKLFAPSFI